MLPHDLRTANTNVSNSTAKWNNQLTAAGRAHACKVTLPTHHTPLLLPAAKPPPVLLLAAAAPMLLLAASSSAAASLSSGGRATSIRAPSLNSSCCFSD